ncbi:MAG: hypothetical protein Q9187_007778 [Circinaria calcarea]
MIQPLLTRSINHLSRSFPSLSSASTGNGTPLKDFVRISRKPRTANPLTISSSAEHIIEERSRKNNPDSKGGEKNGIHVAQETVVDYESLKASNKDDEAIGHCHCSFYEGRLEPGQVVLQSPSDCPLTRDGRYMMIVIPEFDYRRDKTFDGPSAEMDFRPRLDPATLLLAATTLYSVYITNRAFQRPNPDVPDPSDVDRWKSPAFDLVSIGLKYSIPLLGILHSLIVLSGPHPPAYLCPNSQNLNPALFTWSLPSIVAFTLLSTFGNIRLWTYRALGKNFVYQLNRPSHLVTTGPYAYAQHPSYPAVLIVWFTLHASLTRLDGVLGCWLPQRVTQWASVVAALHCTGWAVFLGWVIPPRVRDEEVMLKREFPGEWERWSRRTARFIPGIY